MVIVDSDPNDAQMRLNVVNISNFFLLSGQIKEKSNSHATEEMSATSFKLDYHFGIIEGIYNRGFNYSRVFMSSDDDFCDF